MRQVPLNSGALFLFSEGRKGPKRSESLYFPSTLSGLILYIRVPCDILSEKKVGFLFVSLFLKF